MPQVDLSTLGGPELRQLLDSARRRGQASLSYQILQEMEARRSRGTPRRPIMPGHRAAEPKMVAYEFGDPLEPREEPEPLPAWEPPPEPEPELEAEATSEPEPQAEAEPPLRLERDPPATKGRRRRKASEAAAPVASESAPPPPAVKRQRARVPVLGFSLGIALGAALGWWVAKGAPFELSPRVAAPNMALAANTATAAPVPEATRLPPVNALPAPIAEAPPTPTAGPSAAAEAETLPSAPPEATEVAQETPPPASPRPAARAAQEDSEAAAPTTTVAAKGCAGQATPADRAICGSPNLQTLQRELRQAYAKALDAHEDRALLREHQLAWRDARDGISDPQRLTRLYEARIRKLEAATADARRHR